MSERTCTSCGGRCEWVEDAWTCKRCGDEWDVQHGPEFAAPADVIAWYAVWKPGRQALDTPPWRGTVDTVERERPDGGQTYQRIWRCDHRHRRQITAVNCAERALLGPAWEGAPR